MNEQNMITDVRGAKIWFDAQVPTLDELGLRLRAVEQAYRARTGVVIAPDYSPDA